MKLILNIMAIAAGCLMVLPKVWPWLRGMSEKGPRFYKPDAYTDVIISDFLISAENDLAHFPRFHGGRRASVAAISAVEAARPP